jgi:hypothetical protein
MHLLAKDGAYPDGHDLFLQRVGSAYHAFIEAAEKATRHRCLEDLASATRYVTWSLHTKSRDGLKAVLSRPVDGGRAGGAGGAANHAPSSALTTRVADGGTVADLLESTLWSRQLGAVSEDLVAALVCQIFEGIRDHVVQSVELKFNCFFLMPVVDAFPAALRDDVEAAYGDLDTVFDVGAVRAALEARLRSLECELAQGERLQRKFASIHSTLAQQAARGGAGGGESPVRGVAGATADENAAAAAAARVADKMRGVAVSASADAGRASVGGRAALASLR